MLRIVVGSHEINALPLPGMGNKNVELWNISLQRALEIRRAHAAGELEVRLDTEDGEIVPVTGIWVDPHDPSRITLFLG